MNILITGGCGFIGSHLAEYNLNLGHNVLVVDDLSTGSLANIANFESHSNFQFVQADMIQWESLESAVKWADCVYHLAAVVGVQRVLDNPLGVIQTNINACDHLFNAIVSAGTKPRVILASSSMVYGSSSKRTQSEIDPLIIKSTLQGHWIYAITKIVDESLGFAYSKEHHIPTTILRLFNVIGPRQSGRYGMVVPRFIQQACSNQPVTVYGDGTQTRSFCDVRDIITTMCMIAENERCIGEIINIGNTNEISMKNLAKLIIKLTHSQSKIEYVPYIKAYGHEFTDIHNRKPDLTKLHELTKHKNEYSLDQTINELIDVSKKQLIKTDFIGASQAKRPRHTGQ